MSTKADTTGSNTTLRKARKTTEEIEKRLRDLIPHDTLGNEFDTLNKKESDEARKLLELGNVINRELLQTYSPGNDASEKAVVSEKTATAVNRAKEILDQ